MTDALMMRLLASGALASPNHLDPPHQCCWIVGYDYEQCGLWCGHDGDHVPYTPGVYLPPPTIHPLTLFVLLQHHRHGTGCPICGARADWLGCDGLYGVQRDGNGSASWFEPEDYPGSVERAWRFGPCGCEGRELLP